MLTVADAQRSILDRFQPLETETVLLEDVLGRALAEDLVSPISVPPFANSAMDGYALRAEDTESDEPVVLSVTHEVPAGALDPGNVVSGAAARIMTGAPVPRGADAVVPFEETSFRPIDSSSATSLSSSEDERGVLGYVAVPSKLKTGACIRPMGLDIGAGDVILKPGAVLGSRQIALAASVGISAIRVTRRPIVSILTTGDELIEPGNPLRPGQIYNSNAYGLAAAVREVGAIPRVHKTAADDPVSLRETLLSLTDADLILSSGGVSVGDFDYVKQVIGELGSIDFWRIRMRPGKPLMVGELPSAFGKAVPIIGLPGNPTSTMVTFFVLAKPAILKLMGVSECLPQPVVAETVDAVNNEGGRETYFRVRVEVSHGRLIARLAGGQDSSQLLPLARANALARVPFDVTSVSPGDPVDIFWV